MKSVSEFPKTGLVVKGRKSKYDYDKLFDGKVWELKQGKNADYENLKSTCGSLRIVASKRGLSLTIKYTADEKQLFVQASPKKKKITPAKKPAKK